MLGNMMSGQLLISGLIEHAEKYHSDAEIVSRTVEGPTCSEITMLVGLTPELFRCMNCGADLQQHVNGKITYLPVITARDDGGVPVVKDWLK